MTTTEPITPPERPLREMLDRVLPEGTYDPDTLVALAASGLVQITWRNSPVENAHCSRRGPHDGEMMAESVHLFGVARDLLRADPLPLAWDSAFERHLLDFDRLWTGTPRTVRDMLYGHMGAFRKHVRTTLLGAWSMERDEGRDVLLRFLACSAALRHFGMPDWGTIADRAADLIAHPDDPDWHGRGHDHVAHIPQRLRDHPEELRTALREDPLSLGVEALYDIIASTVFYSADKGVREAVWL